MWLALLATQGLPVFEHLFPHPNGTVSLHNGWVGRVKMWRVRKKYAFSILLAKTKKKKMGTVNTPKPEWLLG